MELQSQNENIQHVIAKYTKEEQKLDSEMKKCEVQRTKMESCLHIGRIRDPKKSLYVKNDEAKNRNKKLLMDLEMCRARLRTLTSFTPTEQELAERMMTYREYLSNM
ncbi:hypothetical protein PV327_007377 [Microctonus hyperodae]|uniref:Uncharacterized protein n=1 Tax=Microctonus hyperodae TaxID=165561 RepID=A0AA39G0C8_MICHY|nr:hypothetical protein PV327_007377 [Microctonus hyperodae]